MGCSGHTEFFSYVSYLCVAMVVNNPSPLAYLCIFPHPHRYGCTAHSPPGVHTAVLRFPVLLAEPESSYQQLFVISVPLTVRYATKGVDTRLPCEQDPPRGFAEVDFENTAAAKHH